MIQEQPKRLTRREDGEEMIAGVCAGLADYFNVDPTLVRAIFVLMFVTGGVGLPLYIGLWLIMPEASAAPRSPRMVEVPEDEVNNV